MDWNTIKEKTAEKFNRVKAGDIVHNHFASRGTLYALGVLHIQIDTTSGEYTHSEVFTS